MYCKSHTDDFRSENTKQKDSKFKDQMPTVPAVSVIHIKIYVVYYSTIS